MKGFRVTKNPKEIKFEGSGASSNQKQVSRDNQRLALVFARNSALQGKFIYIFQEFFARIDKIFILAGRLRTGVSFYSFYGFIKKSQNMMKMIVARNKLRFESKNVSYK